MSPPITAWRGDFHEALTDSGMKEEASLAWSRPPVGTADHPDPTVVQHPSFGHRVQAEDCNTPSWRCNAELGRPRGRP